MVRLLITLLLSLSLTGCYYLQAAQGQWEVLRKRQPVEELIEDPETPVELAARLRLLDEARDFSIDELGLPDNKSYRSYSELEREYVVWNVFAAPEFSLQAKHWCFPVAGCVSYRGYFEEDDAHKLAARLKRDGYDVSVGGVPAYSTLGNFNDPILSTMMNWDDVYLVSVLFHELAHQVVYVKGDTAFNESFATTVQEFGVRRWLSSRGEDDKMQEFQQRRALQKLVTERVIKARSNLQTIYESDMSEFEMRTAKRAAFGALARDIADEMERHGRDGSGWLSSELSNANIISVALYEGSVPAFQALLAQCNDNLVCFYAEAERLASLDEESRIDALASRDLLGSDARLNE